MFIGFHFDWLLVFGAGAIWAGILSRMPDSSPWTSRWILIVGLGYALCWAMAAAGMMTAIDASSAPDGDPAAGQAMIDNARLGTQLVVSGGLVWLVVLTAVTFTTTPPPKKKEPDAE